MINTLVLFVVTISILSAFALLFAVIAISYNDKRKERLKRSEYSKMTDLRGGAK